MRQDHAAGPEDHRREDVVLEVLQGYHRLVLVTPYPPDRSGIAEIAWSLVSRLSRASASQQLVVLGNRPPTAESSEGVSGPARLLVLEAWAYDDILAAARLLREIDRHDPDLVVFNGHVGLWGSRLMSNLSFNLVPILCRLRGLRVAMINHLRLVDLPSDPSIQPRLSPLTRLAGRLVEAAVRRASHHHLQVGAALVPAQPDGAHLDLWCPYHLERSEAPRATGLSILTFGSWGHHKRLEDLLDAWTALCEQHPDWRLTIAGVEHPKCPGYLDSLIERAACDPRLELLLDVPRSRLARLIASCDVIILPFRFLTGQSLSHVIAESALKPVLVPRANRVWESLRSQARHPELLHAYTSPGTLRELLKAIDAARATAKGDEIKA
jgi:glycosyltransferase involved in cell wall biosynthesis